MSRTPRQWWTDAPWWERTLACICAPLSAACAWMALGVVTEDQDQGLIGQDVRDGVFAFTVTEAQHAGSDFVVTMTITNTSDEAQEFRPELQALIDTAGYKYGGASTVEDVYLSPGVPDIVELVFDYPPTDPAGIALRDVEFSNGALVLFPSRLPVPGQ